MTDTSAAGVEAMCERFILACDDEMAGDAIATLRAQQARIERLEAVAHEFVALESSVMADIATAHSRGPGASDWMREDDRDMRASLRHAFGLARAALSPHQDAAL